MESSDCPVLEIWRLFGGVPLTLGDGKECEKE